jgi:hypothetical protein
MKKTPRKLVLRSETLRALTNMDLARAAGGFDTNAVFDTGLKACSTTAPVVDSAAYR